MSNTHKLLMAALVVAVAFFGYHYFKKDDTATA